MRRTPPRSTAVIAALALAGLLAACDRSKGPSVPPPTPSTASSSPSR
jgi:hypothetical protein